MIRLKTILLEQNIYDQQAIKDFNDPNRAIASRIYKAKGTFRDNETAAIEAILEIKNLQQLNSVEKFFVEMSEGRTLSEYLISFLEDLDENLQVLYHYYDLSKNNEFALEVYVYPYAADLLYEYRSDISSIGANKVKQSGRTTPVGRSEVELLYNWFKPYLGEENFNRWIDIKKTDKTTLITALNPNRQVELFKYGKSKLISTGVILSAQIVVGTVAAVISAGTAAPAVVAWLALGTSAGMGLYDAGQEWNLGHKQVAYWMAAIEMIPFVTKIPGVKNVIRSAGAGLARKLAGGITYLTSEEKYLAKILFEHSDDIADKMKQLENTVENRGVLPDPAMVGGESIPLNKVYGTSTLRFGEYGSLAGKPKAVLAMLNQTGAENYIAYTAVPQGSKTIYKLTAKAEWQLAGFKKALQSVSKILPNHILTESTSISIEGIRWWSNQIKNGYKVTPKTFTVPLNKKGASNFVKQIFNTKAEAEAAIAEIRAKGFIQQIPGSDLNIRALGNTGPKKQYVIDVTLPELQSSLSSLASMGIVADALAPGVAAEIQSN